MTTAYLVNEWEKHCEAMQYSDFAESRIWAASKELQVAKKKLNEALDWIGKACDELNNEETQPLYDKLMSLYSDLDAMEVSVSSYAEAM